MPLTPPDPLTALLLTAASITDLSTCASFPSLLVRDQRFSDLRKVVGLNQLVDLTQIAEVHYRKTSGSIIKLRFTVDTDFNLVFALEGKPSAIIPAHSTMINKGKSITAGNVDVQLIEGKVKILGFNHKSGDYRPSYESLGIFLSILFVLESSVPNIIIPKKLDIERLDSSGGHIGRVIAQKSELQEGLASLIELLKTMPQFNEALLPQHSSLKRKLKEVQDIDQSPSKKSRVDTTSPLIAKALFRQDNMPKTEPSSRVMRKLF